MTPWNKKLGIDLGSSYVRVFSPGEDIVLSIPSLVALDKDTYSVVAFGEEAERMVGKIPLGIELLRPVTASGISDYRAAEALLMYIFDTVLGKWNFFKPDVLLSAPSNITSAARRSLSEVALKSGARSVYIIKAPILGALGVGLPVQEAGGYMIADVGGSTSDIAVISLGGIVSSLTLTEGGNDLDKSISDYIRKSMSLIIGERTAEAIKLKLGSALASGPDADMDVTGNDLVSGMPRTVHIHRREIVEILDSHCKILIQSIRSVLHDTPPELASDIMDRGVTFVGNGALLSGLTERIYEETHIPATLSKDPGNAVVRGMGKALEHLDVYKRWSTR